MNLLLLGEEELRDFGARVTGRKARHIRAVLKKGPGDTLRAGVENKGTCRALISRIEEEQIDLELGPLCPVEQPRTHLVVAVPRPKALSRLVSAACSFGLGSLTLINAWKVEKSYFASPRLAANRLLEDARLGCEQGAQVWVPQPTVVRLFTDFLESFGVEKWGEAADLVLMDPNAPKTLDRVLLDETRGPSRPTVLLLGPEGGFIPRELASLEAAGYRAATMRTGPLKTEVALAAALGQLALLRPPPPIPAAE